MQEMNIWKKIFSNEEIAEPSMENIQSKVLENRRKWRQERKILMVNFSVHRYKIVQRFLFHFADKLFIYTGLPIKD